MRSSPQSGFSVAMRRISWRSSSGIGGRPGLDLMRQNSRQPARCQRISVSGRTTTRASRQSKSRESNASDTRVAASTRLGFDATLQIQRKLPAEKEVLRFDGSPRSERQHNEAGQVGKQLKDDSSQRRSRHDHVTAWRRSRNEISSSRIQYLRSTAPLFTDALGESEKERIQNLIDALCSWPMWSTKDSDELKAMRSNTVKNMIDAFPAYGSKRLLKDAGII